MPSTWPVIVKIKTNECQATVRNSAINIYKHYYLKIGWHPFPEGFDRWICVATFLKCMTWHGLLSSQNKGILISMIS